MTFDSTIVVTGAAGGIGSAVCRLLAARGARVAALDMADRDGRALAEPVAEAIRAEGGQAVAAAADLRRPADLAAATAAVADRLGPIGGVFANAGLLRPGTNEDLAPEDWQKSLDVNVTGTWNTVRAALPHFRPEGGAIVLTSSVAGATGMSGYAGYVMSKHAVVGMMRSLAHELGPRSIRVNTVHPTSVNTPMVNNPDHAERRTGKRGPEGIAALREFYRNRHLLPVAWLEPEDVAHAVAWLLSAEARYITGVTLPVDAGLLAK
ncbi:SDR family oxidoreductase [Amycolatopsis panacis]|uniref:SDR family oxidoreductase n=1 Tax=Amycolatopsis panacis TaxID=2340917 RepID=A0A419HJD3_9PSEU|nr:SDR family oxidoreductase [Amycolatopsis panacis]RJQ75908.1 SDR family oxidoreductase [Amycolatopsis panacis]